MFTAKNPWLKIPHHTTLTLILVSDVDGQRIRSEILFGFMHLLGFAFAPRIKNFAKCQLYSFNKRKWYQQQGYKILPDAYIKTETVASQWDEILRFIATIKLKETTSRRHAASEPYRLRGQSFQA